MRQYWLFNPGPVNTSESVKNAAIGPDLCHREPEYAALMSEVRSGLLRIAGLKDKGYTSCLITGSGTAAMELGVSSLVRPGRSLLVIRNGVYGDRIAKIAALHGIPTREVEAAWTARPDLAAVQRALETHDDIDAVALVHHETTTGLLNPVREVGDLCRKHGKIFFLDSVSGFGGEELDIAEASVDVLAATANKCLHGLPGLSFVLVSDRAIAHIADVAPRSLYFDLKNYIKLQDQGDIPFTPCIPATYALAQAIRELESEGGIPSRIRVYKERSSFLRKELKAAGLELFLSEDLLSNTITTFRLPASVDYPSLHDALKDKGFVIYAGQGKLASEIFRLANLGHVPMGVYAELVRAIRAFVNGGDRR